MKTVMTGAKYEIESEETGDVNIETDAGLYTMKVGVKRELPAEVYEKVKTMKIRVHKHIAAPVDGGTK